MTIQPDLTITDIQRQFTKVFPGLRLSFYEKAHNSFEGSQAATTYAPTRTLGSIQPALKPGTLTLNPALTVAELEAALEQQFGLHVQVLRRSNQLWLQTTSTDGWTLEVQNRKGLHSSQD